MTTTSEGLSAAKRPQVQRKRARTSAAAARVRVMARILSRRLQRRENAGVKFVSGGRCSRLAAVVLMIGVAFACRQSGDPARETLDALVRAAHDRDASDFL